MCLLSDIRTTLLRGEGYLRERIGTHEGAKRLLGGPDLAPALVCQTGIDTSHDAGQYRVLCGREPYHAAQANPAGRTR